MSALQEETIIPCMMPGCDETLLVAANRSVEEVARASDWRPYYVMLEGNFPGRMTKAGLHCPKHLAKAR